MFNRFIRRPVLSLVISIIIVLLGSTPDRVFRDAKRLFEWHHKQLKLAGYL